MGWEDGMDLGRKRCLCGCRNGRIRTGSYKWAVQIIVRRLFSVCSLPYKFKVLFLAYIN